MSPGGMLRCWLAFAEAFLTVEAAGLAGVMVQGQQYMWPSWPALVSISVGALLAGVRRVQSTMGAPPT